MLSNGDNVKVPIIDLEEIEMPSDENENEGNSEKAEAYEMMINIFKRLQFSFLSSTCTITCPGIYMKKVKSMSCRTRNNALMPLLLMSILFIIVASDVYCAISFIVFRVLKGRLLCCRC